MKELQRMAPHNALGKFMIVSWTTLVAFRGSLWSHCSTWTRWSSLGDTLRTAWCFCPVETCPDSHITTSLDKDSYIATKSYKMSHFSYFFVGVSLCEGVYESRGQLLGIICRLMSCFPGDRTQASGCQGFAQVALPDEPPCQPQGVNLFI